MKFTGLIIMDGYGINKFGENNAISPETSPNVLALEKKYPFTQLNASGLGLEHSAGGRSALSFRVTI